MKYSLRKEENLTMGLIRTLAPTTAGAQGPTTYADGMLQIGGMNKKQVALFVKTGPKAVKQVWQPRENNNNKDTEQLCGVGCVDII